jgi:hypothetical protein
VFDTEVYGVGPALYRCPEGGPIARRRHDFSRLSPEAGFRNFMVDFWMHGSEYLMILIKI